MMSRIDLSKHLVHWTKGDTYDEAFEALLSIIFDNVLIGGSGNIKGQYRCVCFTEAPQDVFHMISGKYKPFGIRVSKKWLFELGGLPVIYQPDSYYRSLPEGQRWRHVRYEPCLDPPIDFTWEREWRIMVDELSIGPQNSHIIVPHQDWADALENEFNTRAHYEAMNYDYEYMYWPEEFNWGYSVVSV